MRVLPSGPDAVLLEFSDGAEVIAYLDGLDAARGAQTGGPGSAGTLDGLAGLVETVPAARTLLLRGRSPSAMPALVRAARAVVPGRGATSSSREVRIETSYDGEDLAAAADHLGLSPEGLVARHTELVWTVAFCGFSPGFAYMTCDDPAWSVPRRESPRTRVPAGSIALAGGYTGCYPTPSPGGWQLIGRTDAPLWATDREPPALLVPGTRVRFVDVTGGATGWAAR